LQISRIWLFGARLRYVILGTRMPDYEYMLVGIPLASGCQATDHASDTQLRTVIDLNRCRQTASELQPIPRSLSQ
jgi:hypothetical protein